MSGQWHGGKGSKPRPISVPQEEYEDRWNLIFNKPSLRDQYDNYVAQMQSLGEPHKSFDEWLHS